MLPVVTEDILTLIRTELDSDSEDWKRALLQRIREDNPEVNTLLLEAAKSSDDPKSLILGGYLVYCALEIAEQAEASLLNIDPGQI